MPKDRFFIKSELTVGKSAFLEGDEARHMRLVMRKAKGAQIELINGKGALAKASILNESKKGVELDVLDVELQEKSATQTYLLQAIIRPQKVELIIEKAVELGIDHITLFEADYSDKKHVKPERLEHISISALKQSGRLFMPQIAYAKSLDEALFSSNQALDHTQINKTKNTSLFYGDIEGISQHKLFTNIDQTKKSSMAFVIGPEGGLSPKEIELLKQQKAQSVKLGPYMLRSETASILACSFITKVLCF